VLPGAQIPHSRRPAPGSGSFLGTWGLLVSLEEVSLMGCDSLDCLPASLAQSVSLKVLTLVGLPLLDKVPLPLATLIRLQRLCVPAMPGPAGPGHLRPVPRGTRTRRSTMSGLQPRANCLSVLCTVCTVKYVMYSKCTVGTLCLYSKLGNHGLRSLPVQSRVVQQQIHGALYSPLKFRFHFVYFAV